MSFNPDRAELNKHMKSYFGERLIRLFIHLFTLTMLLLNSHTLGSTLTFTKIATSYSTNILTIRLVTQPILPRRNLLII